MAKSNFLNGESEYPSPKPFEVQGISDNTKVYV